MARSRVELFEQIRKDRRAGRSSIRELADRHHVHRRTVRQALAISRLIHQASETTFRNGKGELYV
jgi:hypothetical protein